MQRVRLLDNKPSEWLAHRFYVLGQYDMCLNVVEQILRRSPTNAEALSLKGCVLRTKGQIDDALNCFQTAYNLDSENTRNLFDIAKCLFFVGRYQQSLKILDKFEGTDERNTWEVCQLFAQNYAKLKKMEEAKNSFQDALDIEYRLETVLELIDIYEAEKNLGEIETLLNEALKYHGNNTILRKRIGRLSLRLKRFDQALNDFTFAFTRDRDDYQSMLYAGSIQQENQSTTTAMLLYRKSFVGVSGSPALWNNVALCVQARQRREAVITCCRKAMFFAPFEAVPVANLGLVFLEMGMFCSAAIALKRAKALDPNNQNAAIGLAVALMNLGDQKQAISILKKELEKAKEKRAWKNNVPRILINLALSYRRDGAKDEATKTYAAFQKAIHEEVALESLYPVDVLKKIFGGVSTTKTPPLVS